MTDTPPEDLAFELGWTALGAIGEDDGCEAARAMGDGIVGTAEMQAIKRVLRAVIAAEHHSDDLASMARGLPRIVTDWVMS